MEPLFFLAFLLHWTKLKSNIKIQTDNDFQTLHKQNVWMSHIEYLGDEINKN